MSVCVHAHKCFFFKFFYLIIWISLKGLKNGMLYELDWMA